MRWTSGLQKAGWMGEGAAGAHPDTAARPRRAGSLASPGPTGMRRPPVTGRGFWLHRAPPRSSARPADA